MSDRTPVSILIVDDSEDDRDYFQSLLLDAEPLNFRVDEAETVRAGLDKLIEREYDCLLLDYSMPGHNGIWLVREMRIRNIHVPVVMLTGGGSENVAVEAMKAGVQDYLSKAEVNSENLVNGIEFAIARMQKELELFRLVNEDELTGLANRHSFFKSLEAAVQKAARSGNNIAILFLDLNKFKAINDTHGHPVGDAVLQEFGSRLQDCCRDYDTIARLGGDEFVFLMEELGPDSKTACIAMANRIIRAINDNDFVIEELKLSVKTSIGISIFPELCTDRNRIIEMADKAMYDAKQQEDTHYILAPPC